MTNISIHKPSSSFLALRVYEGQLLILVNQSPHLKNRGKGKSLHVSQQTGELFQGLWRSDCHHGLGVSVPWLEKCHGKCAFFPPCVFGPDLSSSALHFHEQFFWPQWNFCVTHTTTHFCFPPKSNSWILNRISLHYSQLHTVEAASFSGWMDKEKG